MVRLCCKFGTAFLIVLLTIAYLLVHSFQKLITDDALKGCEEKEGFHILDKVNFIFDPMPPSTARTFQYDRLSHLLF